MTRAVLLQILWELPGWLPISSERPHFHCYVLEKTPKTIFGPRKILPLALHELDAVGPITEDSGVGFVSRYAGGYGLYDMADTICWQHFITVFS